MHLLHCLVIVVLPTIWIVDASNGPGTNFTDLPAAVAAAASGDTIIVRAGTYSGFNVTGKALTIRGAGAPVTTIGLAPPFSQYGHTAIENVPAGLAFFMSGMRFVSFVPPGSPPPGLLEAGLRVFGSTTDVVLADVAVSGVSNGNTLTNGTPGLVVSGGAIVHAARSSFIGGGGGLYGTSGSGAIVEAGCALAADASTFTGLGTPPNSIYYRPGGTGLVVSGTATLARSSAFGGEGYFGGNGIVVNGFVRLTGTSANSIIGSTMSWPGLQGRGLVVAGSAVVHGNVTLGPPGFASSGPITFDPVPLPYLSVAGVDTPGGELLPGQPVTFSFDGGISSAPFALIVDLLPSFSTPSLAVGELLLPVPTSFALQGTLNAAGHSQLTLTPATAFPSLLGIPVYAQLGVYDAVAAKYRLSNGLIRIYQ